MPSVAADDVAPWVERLARVGFLAKGVLYMTIGALATSAALGHRGTKSADNRSALYELSSAPLGRALLAIIALGLAGYAVWRVIEGLHDPARRGTSAKGLALRAGFVGGGIVHGFLAYSAACVALQRSPGASEGDQAKQMSARALELPGGEVALWIAAAALIGYGGYQLYHAWRAKLEDQLVVEAGPEARRLIYGVSRFGIAARGTVFAAMGMLFVRAATHRAPHESGGVAESMQWLVQLGRWPFFVIAVGLAAYGVYQLFCAKWMRIAVR